MARKIILLLLVLFLNACNLTEGASSETELPKNKSNVEPHIFIIMADDLGTDVGPCHSDEVFMPNLQARCSNSLILKKAYAYASCSATRASLLTGRHSFRHGVNDVKQSVKKLPLAEVTLAEWILENAEHYRTAAFGKWHLADDENGGVSNPNLQGFNHYEGTPRQSGTYDYFEYDWYVNGENQGKTNTYKTTQITNSVVNDFTNNNEQPQFYYVNYVNPHLPYHKPPAELHSVNLTEQSEPELVLNHSRNPKLDPFYFAMMEALDTEIERLIEQTISLSKRPIVFIFLGDNGSAQDVYRGDISGGYRGKASLYEGGIHIPMQIWSSDNDAYPIVQGSSDILVHTVDLYATIAQLIRPNSVVSKQATDSQSFAPVFADLNYTNRKYLYIQVGHPRRMPFSYVAINDSGMKLLLNETVRPSRFSKNVYLEYYDTQNDPGERNNLFNTPCIVDFDEVNKLMNFLLRKRESEKAPIGNKFDKVFYQNSLLDLQQQCAN